MINNSSHRHCCYVDGIATHCLPACSPKSAFFPCRSVVSRDCSHWINAIKYRRARTFLHIICLSYKQWNINIVAHHLYEPSLDSTFCILVSANKIHLNKTSWALYSKNRILKTQFKASYAFTKLSWDPPGGGTPIWNRRGCSSSRLGV